MFDFVPPSIASSRIWQVLVPRGAGALTPIAVWHRPRGVSMLHILVAGPGGNGGNGGVGAATAAGGGGGGGSAGFSSGFIPAFLLPPVLYVLRSTTEAVYVGIRPDSTTDVHAQVLYAEAGGNGGNGSTTGGAIGTGGAVATTASATISGSLLRGTTFQAGGNGNGGGLNLAGFDISVVTTIQPFHAGAGGGGVGASGAGGFAGGVRTAAGLFQAQPAAPGGATSTSSGAVGSNGSQMWPGLWKFDGGGGGGSSGGAGGNGGRGGDGALGCGGGGGGACFTGGTAGVGGRGGPGCVIITMW